MTKREIKAIANQINKGLDMNHGLVSLVMLTVPSISADIAHEIIENIAKLNYCLNELINKENNNA